MLASRKRNWRSAVGSTIRPLPAWPGCSSWIATHGGAQAAATDLAASLREALKSAGLPASDLIGPTPAFLARLRADSTVGRLCYATPTRQRSCAE
jgi:hypothetical protein